MDHYYMYAYSEDVVEWMPHTVVKVSIPSTQNSLVVACFHNQDDAVAFVQRKNNGV